MLAELLLESKSVSVEATVAVFVIEPWLLGMTLIVMTAPVPTANVPILQFTGPLPLQLPCVDEADPNVMPPGKVSETVTLVAVAGPLLVATSRYERVDPTWPGLGDAVFVIDKSTLEALTILKAAAAECINEPD